MPRLTIGAPMPQNIGMPKHVAPNWSALLLEMQSAGMKQAEICAAANAVDNGGGVVVVTDMFGGSPANLSLLACADAVQEAEINPLLVKTEGVVAVDALIVRHS